MPCQFKNKQSKRMKAKLRYKIDKKVKEHKRKQKKDEKKNPLKYRKRKDPGVPNSLPFKHVILKEAAEWKAQVKAAKEETRKREREDKFNASRDLTDLVVDAKKKESLFVQRSGGLSEAYEALRNAKTENKGPVEHSLKSFYKEFKKVIDQADVILEVLDARDPLGTRCKEVEDAIISSGFNKKLVLILNKIDLIPRENTEAWLKYLKNEFPTVPFKTSLQKQKDHLCHATKLPIWKELEKKTANCLGADLLMKLLGNYCRSQGIKTAIRVGVVGLPNTGKSSIINSLKRSRVCNVGAMPGMTRSMQEVNLTKHIKLLDSPGVVMSENPSDTSLILKNCVKLTELDDLTAPIEAILRRCNKEQIMLHYNIPNYRDTSEFLAILARKWGRLKKGGRPNVNKAAKILLQHWNSGRISYFTQPPEDTTTHISAEIVSEMGKAFDMDAIKDDEIKILQATKPMSSSYMSISSSQPVTCVMDIQGIEKLEASRILGNDNAEEDEESMDEEKDGNSELKATTVSLSGSQATSMSSLPTVSYTQKSDKDDTVDVEQRNKSRKVQFKKMKKMKKKADALASELADEVECAMNFDMTDDKVDSEDDTAMNSGSDYEFEDHF